MYKISVIIPTYKDWERLQLCLVALEKQTLPLNEFEVIVVNNHIDDEIPQFQFSYQLKILRETKSGSYAARNTGVAASSAPFLAFTDSDCICDENWLLNALELIETAACDTIGGCVQIFKASPTSSRVAYLYDKHMAFRQIRNVKMGVSVTANLIVKREVFDFIGGFNAEAKSGGDWHFTKQTVNAGFKLIYGANVIVKHPARYNFKQLVKKQKRLASWGYIVKREHKNQSGMRIILTNVVDWPRKMYRNTGHIKKIGERLFVIVISFVLLSVLVYTQLRILIRLDNPSEVRS